MIQRSLLRRSFMLSYINRAPISVLFPPLVRTTPATVSRAAPLSFYSSTPDSKPAADSETVNKKTQDAVSSVTEAEDSVKKELDAKNREIIDLKDKYLRSVADFRNLQDRTARDIAQARDFAITRFAKDLLESVDNLDRAISTVPKQALESNDHKALQDLHGGLKMTETALMKTLSRHGLERFDPSEKGEKFDPNLHEATFMTKMEDKEDGSVFDTIQKGFMLNGRVVRAAKVGVVKNS